jgi:CHASE3 domain sensor protein
MSVDKRISLVLALVIVLTVGAGAVAIYLQNSRRRRSYALRRASSSYATHGDSHR